MVSFLPAMPHSSENGIDRVISDHLSDVFYPEVGVESSKCKSKPDRTLSFSIDSILGFKSKSHFSVSRARNLREVYASELSSDNNVRFNQPPTMRDHVVPQRFVPRTTESWTELHHSKLQWHRAATVVCRCGFEPCDYTHKPWQARSKHLSLEPENLSDSRTVERRVSCYMPSWQCLPCPFSLSARGDGCRCEGGSYRGSGGRSCDEVPCFTCADAGCCSVKRSGACKPTDGLDESLETSLRMTNRCVESKPLDTLQSVVDEASDCVCPVTCRPTDFMSVTERDVCPTGNLTMQYMEEKHKGRRIGHPYRSRAPPKRKPVRHSFTTSQVAQLEKLFDKSKYLSSSDRQRVATQLSMTDSQLKTWYQNRRTKMKREIAEMQEQQQRVYEKMTSTVVSS